MRRIKESFGYDQSYSLSTTQISLELPKHVFEDHFEIAPEVCEIVLFCFLVELIHFVVLQGGKKGTNSIPVLSNLIGTPELDRTYFWIKCIVLNSLKIYRELK